MGLVGSIFFLEKKTFNFFAHTVRRALFKNLDAGCHICRKTGNPPLSRLLYGKASSEALEARPELD